MLLPEEIRAMIATMTAAQAEARLAEIRTAVDAEDADLDMLEAETRAINERLEELRTQADAEAETRRAAIRSGATVRGFEAAENTRGPINEREERARRFVEENRISIGAEETRAVLISGGTLATPTEVSGIHDMVGGGNVSVLDMISVVNCEGMGKNRVSYVDSEAGAAANQTEGQAASSAEPTFGYVDITPTSIACTAQISKQAKKQTPLQYESKVESLALKSLRKKAVAIMAAALKASTITQELVADVDGSKKGTIGAKTLRKIAFAYGGSDEIDGGAVLFLNKVDLIAFGDVRGTNEKKAVYEITPDGSNPNRGIIEDGGLKVPYCIMSGLTACEGTAESATAKTPTMFYGNPLNFELDLFSDYEVRVSEDFAITSLMDTIVGDAEVGGDVVVKNGFVAYTLPKDE